MNTGNEIEAHIIRGGMTMNKVLDKLSEKYGWSKNVPNFPVSSSATRSGIRKPWSWLTYSAMILSGKNVSKCSIPRHFRLVVIIFKERKCAQSRHKNRQKPPFKKKFQTMVTALL